MDQPTAVSGGRQRRSSARCGSRGGFPGCASRHRGSGRVGLSPTWTGV